MTPPPAATIWADPRDWAACVVLGDTVAGGHAANVAACLSAGLFAGRPDLAGQPLCDGAGWTTAASANLPVAVLRGGDAVFTRLAPGLAGAPAEARVVLFPRYAQAIHDIEVYRRRYAAADHQHELWLGLGLLGPRAWIKRLTGALPLFRG